jgi:hypothetical protein
MPREETPLQVAKRLGLPYVKLVVDVRHLHTGGGKQEIEGAVSHELLGEARDLFGKMMGGQ